MRSAEHHRRRFSSNGSCDVNRMVVIGASWTGELLLLGSVLLVALIISTGALAAAVARAASVGCHVFSRWTAFRRTRVPREILLGCPHATLVLFHALSRHRRSRPARD